MSLNSTPSSERTHIGIFGKRNAGKSSLINAMTGQSLAIVSDVKGTTTDPVLKSMELLPLGPVVMMDTPGIDDEGGLGGLRVKKSYQVLNKTDAAVLVIDGAAGASAEDAALLDRIRKKNIPYTVALNKQDLAAEDMLKQAAGILDISAEQILAVSAADGTGITELKERISYLTQGLEEKQRAATDVDEFIRRMKKHINAPELTRELCLELFEKLVIGGKETVTGKPQEIHIYYKIDIDSVLSV